METALAFLSAAAGHAGSDIALGGIVTIVIVLIILGKLVPRAVMKDRMSDKDSNIQELVIERDDWRSAYHAKSEESVVLMKQNTELIEAARTTALFLETFRGVLEEKTKGK